MQYDATTLNKYKTKKKLSYRVNSKKKKNKTNYQAGIGKLKTTIGNWWKSLFSLNWQRFLARKIIAYVITQRKLLNAAKKHQKTMFSLSIKFILKNFQEQKTKTKIQQKSCNSIISTNGGSKMAFRSLKESWTFERSLREMSRQNKFTALRYDPTYDYEPTCDSPKKPKISSFKNSRCRSDLNLWPSSSQAPVITQRQIRALCVINFEFNMKQNETSAKSCEQTCLLE